jgi:hypothetical protein
VISLYAFPVSAKSNVSSAASLLAGSTPRKYY